MSAANGRVTPASLVDELAGFLGSANVQKLLGLAQSAIAETTSAEGHTALLHLGGGIIGAAYALGVHFVDYLRSKTAR